MSDNSSERIDTDIHCYSESLSRRIKILTLQLIPVSKGDCMDYNIKPSECFSDFIKDVLYITITGNITGLYYLCTATLFLRPYTLLQHITCICKGKLRPFPVKRLCNSPRYAALIRNTEYNTFFT